MGRILITGGNGYIAKSLYNTLKDEYEITLITREDFDLTSFEDTQNFFKGKYFDTVIHAAVVGGSRLRKDSWTDMDSNLVMYYNLLENKKSFNRFIHFGSGAENYAKETPYGLSKYVIKKSIEEQDNFFNIQIFGVFDGNELDTRFIKSNIKKYINKESMKIDVHKKMSFFYMEDLIKVVKHTIQADKAELVKEVCCSYADNHTLRQIADIINELDSYRVLIDMTEEFGQDYIAPTPIPYKLPYQGLKQGIEEVFNKLKHI